MTTVSSSEFADPVTRDWRVPLAGLSLAVPLLSPLLVAVLASRMVEIEHRGNGWLLQQTSGISPGVLCRAKLCVGAVTLAAATATTHTAVWLLGRLLGIGAEPPLGLWVGFAVAGWLINLTILGLQLLLSATIDNQLISLGIGVVGTVIASSLPACPRALLAPPPGDTMP